MSDGGLSEGVWWQSSTTELVRELVTIEEQERRVHAQKLRMLSHLDQRGAARELGYPTVGDLYAVAVRINRKEGKRQAERAEALHGRVELGGRVGEATLPHAAEALADGEIAVAHVDQLRRVHDSLPSTVPPEAWAVAEEFLTDVAKDVPPEGMRREIRETVTHLDQDGTEPDARELADPPRTLHTQWRGERLEFDGHLDREAGLLLEAVLDPLAKPRPQQDGERDWRTSAQRHGDALAELVNLAAQSDKLGQQAAEPVTVMVTVQESDLRDGIGVATTMDGATVPIAQLRRMACDAHVIPAVLGTHGDVIDLGDKKRLANARLRRALVLRDKGCAHPHCSAPASRCHVHHLRHWAERGKTDKKNTVLLCAYHHRQVHHASWTVRMRHGMPEFRPPDYLERNLQRPAAPPRGPTCARRHAPGALR